MAPHAKRKNRSWFTVVGFYRDNNQVWVEHAWAFDPQDASYSAIKAIHDKTDGASDPAVVEVFKGQQRGLLQTENIMVLAQGEPFLQELS